MGLGSWKFQFQIAQWMLLSLLLTSTATALHLRLVRIGRQPSSGNEGKQNQQPNLRTEFHPPVNLQALGHVPLDNHQSNTYPIIPLGEDIPLQHRGLNTNAPLPTSAPQNINPQSNPQYPPLQLQPTAPPAPPAPSVDQSFRPLSSGAFIPSAGPPIPPTTPQNFQPIREQPVTQQPLVTAPPITVPPVPTVPQNIPPQTTPATYFPIIPNVFGNQPFPTSPSFPPFPTSPSIPPFSNPAVNHYQDGTPKDHQSRIIPDEESSIFARREFGYPPSPKELGFPGISDTHENYIYDVDWSRFRRRKRSATKKSEPVYDDNIAAESRPEPRQQRVEVERKPRSEYKQEYDGPYIYTQLFGPPYEVGYIRSPIPSKHIYEDYLQFVRSWSAGSRDAVDAQLKANPEAINYYKSPASHSSPPGQNYNSVKDDYKKDDYQLPSHTSPKYEKPAYSEPSYDKKDSYKEASYSTPGYKEPTYTTPAYKEPVYNEPVALIYKEPSYTTPGYKSEPAYKEPAYKEPAYKEPAYKEPAYKEPAYKEPAYKEPAYKEPAYKEPSYTTPGYKELAHKEPSYTTPGYKSEPAYKEPSYTTPSYKEPAYKEPAYKEPAYKEPAYKEPAYKEPAYKEPAYKEPSYTTPGYKEPAYKEPAYTTPKYKDPVPAYTTPGYKEPAYKEPSYTTPGYKEPAYKEPAYKEPSYTTPGYKEPAYKEPSYTTPGYKEPAYKEPAYKEPAHKEPSYTTPGYKEPAYKEPAYKEPVYTTPKYKEPVYTTPKPYSAPVYEDKHQGGNKYDAPKANYESPKTDYSPPVYDKPKYEEPKHEKPYEPPKTYIETGFVPSKGYLPVKDNYDAKPPAASYSPPTASYSPPAPSYDPPKSYDVIYEAPKAYDTPKYDIPKYDPPKSYDPPKYEPPTTFDPSKYDAPKSYDPPKYEAPKAYDPPKYEAPKAYDPPKYEAPKAYDPPKYEAPKTHDIPKYEAPKAYDPPKYEAPKADYDSGVPEYNPPVYEGPKHTSPSYDVPKYTTPSYDLPKLSTASYGNSGNNYVPPYNDAPSKTYNGPSYDAPSSGYKESYTTPYRELFSSPAYKETFSTPSYVPPAYKESYTTPGYKGLHSSTTVYKDGYSTPGYKESYTTPSYKPTYTTPAPTYNNNGDNYDVELSSTNYKQASQNYDNPKNDYKAPVYDGPTKNDDYGKEKPHSVSGGSSYDTTTRRPHYPVIIGRYQVTDSKAFLPIKVDGKGGDYKGAGSHVHGANGEEYVVYYLPYGQPLPVPLKKRSDTVSEPIVRTRRSSRSQKDFLKRQRSAYGIATARSQDDSQAVTESTPVSSAVQRNDSAQEPTATTENTLIETTSAFLQQVSTSSPLISLDQAEIVLDAHILVGNQEDNTGSKIIDEHHSEDTSSLTTADHSLNQDKNDPIHKQEDVPLNTIPSSDQSSSLYSENEAPKTEMDLLIQSLPDISETLPIEQDSAPPSVENDQQSVVMMNNNPILDSGLDNVQTAENPSSEMNEQDLPAIMVVNSPLDSGLVILEMNDDVIPPNDVIVEQIPDEKNKLVPDMGTIILDMQDDPLPPNGHYSALIIEFDSNINAGVSGVKILDSVVLNENNQPIETNLQNDDDIDLTHAFIPEHLTDEEILSMSLDNTNPSVPIENMELEPVKTLEPTNSPLIPELISEIQTSTENPNLVIPPTTVSQLTDIPEDSKSSFIPETDSPASEKLPETIKDVDHPTTPKPSDTSVPVKESSETDHSEEDNSRSSEEYNNKEDLLFTEAPKVLPGLTQRPVKYLKPPGLGSEEQRNWNGYSSWWTKLGNRVAKVYNYE